MTARKIGIAPSVHGCEDRFDAQACRCERVFDLRRHDRPDGARDETVRFKLAQLLREHLGRRVGDGAAQFRVPHRAFEKVPENERLPFAADEVERESNGTERVFCRCVFGHGDIFWGTRYENGAFLRKGTC